MATRDGQCLPTLLALLSSGRVPSLRVLLVLVPADTAVQAVSWLLIAQPGAATRRTILHVPQIAVVTDNTSINACQVPPVNDGTGYGVLDATRASSDILRLTASLAGAATANPHENDAPDVQDLRADCRVDAHGSMGRCPAALRAALAKSLHPLPECDQPGVSAIWSIALHTRDLRLQETAERRRIAADAQNQARLAAARSRYTQHVQGVWPLPELPASKAFTTHADMDWPNDNILILPPGTPLAALEELCARTLECLAFSSAGQLKKAIPSHDKWVSTPGVSLHVANNVDPCLADLHHCAAHASCERKGLTASTCTCQAPYGGDGTLACTPRIALATLLRALTPDVSAVHTGKEVEETRRFLTLGPMDAWDAYAAKAAAHTPFVLIPGLDSPMFDLALVTDLPSKHEERVLALQDACHRHPRCVAVNTNGMLKSQLQPPRLWQRFSWDDLEGTYALDINHCEYAGEGCPAGARCQRLGPAQYECRCVADGSLPQDTNTDRPLDPPNWSCPEVERNAKTIQRTVESKGAEAAVTGAIAGPELRREAIADAGGYVDEIGAQELVKGGERDGPDDGLLLVVFAVDQAQWPGLPAAIK